MPMEGNMSCCEKKNPIIIVKGDSTNFNGRKFLSLLIDSEVYDLSTLSATFTLCGATKTYADLSSGVIDVSYTKAETSTFPLGLHNGVLRFFNQEGEQVTIESLFPFSIISLVHKNAIATQPFEYVINVQQGGETVFDIKVEAGVSVEVGTTTTLPAGSDATVENVGTPNHLVLNFGIPQGIQGEKGDKGDTGNGISHISKTSSSGLIDTYTIYFTNGQTTSFNVENGNGIASIIKTGSVGLVDTYRITYTNGQTFTFNVTNGEDATIIIRRL